MHKVKKSIIFFGVAILAFIVFLGFTVSGFILSSRTSSFSLPDQNLQIISVQSENDFSFVTTDDHRLICYENGEKAWETEIADRTSDVVITSDSIVVSYISERKVDIFEKNSGELINTIEVPYTIVSMDADDSQLYIAAKKGGLNGSVVYYYSSYRE